ncbi:haloacid dehalogenase [Anaerolineales bacterium]
MAMTATKQLDDICNQLQDDLSAMNVARNEAVTKSRELVRHCAESIRATHRREWEAVDEKLVVIRQLADHIKALTAQYPELYHSGYTQDALKEVVEAFITYAIIHEHSLPTATELGVESSTYLNGLAEAATELRRYILDIMRRDFNHSQEAERLLNWMDAIYDQLVTFDFPDALTHGLRRQTDIVRGVLERTRGDMTNSLRQQHLQEALRSVEEKLSQLS